MANQRKSKRKKDAIIWLRNAVYGLFAIAIFSLVYPFQIELA